MATFARSRHLLAGQLDASGNLVALEHRQASGDVAFDFLPGFLSAVMGADFGACTGAHPLCRAQQAHHRLAHTFACADRLVAGTRTAGQHFCR